MKQYIEKALLGEALAEDEAASALDLIMRGLATDAQIAGLLIALRSKGETVDELVGFARTMREHSLRVVLQDPDAVDIVGTGGDGLGTFNISTIAAFIIAGAGVTVAKHGNRSVSSKCGSADLLTALGVNIQLPPQRIEECINDIGIGFLFAPVFHPAMKHAARSRTELGVRTIFNMLGPITNPAGVRRHMIGAYRGDVADKLAQSLARLQSGKAFVVHGSEGMDEVGLTGTTSVHEVDGEADVKRYDLTPSDFGFDRQSIDSMIGGSVEVNASIARSILGGEQGPRRNVVVANAALGILASGKASHLLEAKQMAVDSLDSGSAGKKLTDLIKFTGQS